MRRYSTGCGNSTAGSRSCRISPGPRSASERSREARRACATAGRSFSREESRGERGGRARRLPVSARGREGRRRPVPRRREHSPEGREGARARDPLPDRARRRPHFPQGAQRAAPADRSFAEREGRARPRVRPRDGGRLRRGVVRDVRRRRAAREAHHQGAEIAGARRREDRKGAGARAARRESSRPPTRS